MNKIIRALGKPYFQEDNCLIYNLDCLEGMAKLPNEIINMTVTSPPYNIGKEYEDILSLDEYLAWCKRWIQEVYRLTTINGSFWLNLGYISIPKRAKAIPISYLLWDKIPFYLIQEIVWNYGAGVAAKKFFSPRNEKFLWYVKDELNYIFNLDDIRDPNVKYPNQKKNGKIKVNPMGKNPTDVWQIPKVTSGKNRASKERTPHPCQYPIAVIDRIIKASSNKGDLILDPFLGSGTTAIVALKLDRSVIGFEINSDYCEMAVKRIKTFKSEKQTDVIQFSLFGSV
ncbi:DNA methylase N-4/N-6 domain protein [Gloeothece citriformis PCC 7424]|uniref:Methyltransferase n=1 Tax=Gloeothece citriformis (strain PCC 7424) TaxID=65393 RepID=B7K945_GLOC7|nr:site-specific DNA-methyltransferase [Gloeothece citriformis]ACK72814.1 DNA methylase N-4/N-6 domain protein [Gloeothece citriformis PCC 7424]